MKMSEEEKNKNKKALTATRKAKRAARQHRQAIAFKVAGIPKEKHTFTVKRRREATGKSV